MIQRDSYGFNTFTSTRIGEIQEGSNPDEWCRVNGGDNVTDLIRKGLVIFAWVARGKWLLIS